MRPRPRGALARESDGGIESSGAHPQSKGRVSVQAR
jgi:hypothetical protein